MTRFNDSSFVFSSLLDQIPEMFAETRETETVFGPVIQAGLEALKVSFQVTSSVTNQSIFEAE